MILSSCLAEKKDNLSDQNSVVPPVEPSPPTPTPTPDLVEKINGVTIDSISNINDIVTSLKNLSSKPTTRIVFDEFIAASTYKTAVAKIKDVSFVMGEILDSFYLNQYTVASYEQRTVEYLNTLGDCVDIWEIGNEINGEWVGTTSEVVQKMKSAYDQVKLRGKKAALTLYYNEGCWEDPKNEMFTWTANIPDEMVQNLDYVFVSYYEDDCNDLQPDWPVVFKRLAEKFPKSKIGFGEVGTLNKANKAEFINRYYKLKITEPNYVG